MLNRVLPMLLSILLPLSSLGQAPSGQPVRDGEFWKQQALELLAPYWHRHGRDLTNGAYFTNLSRQWTPKPPHEKYPAMISRQVFGFCAAYLLSGDEQSLADARAGVDYLLEHAWDKQYGGWFDVLTESGEPKETSKTVPYQLYTDVGLTLYYFVTGEERVLARVMESIRIRQTRARDAEFGGYFHALNRDLSVKDAAKSKHGHFGYASSLLIPLFVATRNAEVLQFAEELMQITRDRMMDPEAGWVRGYPKPLSRDWKLEEAGAMEPVAPGAQLTAALAYLRLSEIAGKDFYRKEGLRLTEQITHAAWDTNAGSWSDVIGRKPPYSQPAAAQVSWWVQCYGSLAQLHQYHLTGDERYLPQFDKMTTFYNRYFLDHEFGGVLTTLTSAGSPVVTDKAAVWKTSYHEMEFGLLNYLYLHLYVNHRPATLHFHLPNAKAGTKHFVSWLEDPAITVSAVTINGQPWSKYDPRERSVILPDGDAKMVVTLVAPH